MSNGYRAKWKDDSTREAEVEHFKRLKVAEKFLNLVVKEATVWAEEKEAAIKAGMDPAIAMFGHRACGVDAFGNPLPEKPAAESKGSASTGSGQAGTFSATAAEKGPDPKPKRKQPYRARVYAPQMIALGARAATMLLDLSPLIMAQWKRLVEAGTDPRRLALDDHDGKIAALLFDEIGVQYHEAMATDQEKLREALDKMEAWVRKLKEEEKERADASPACPEELEGPGVSEAGILPADAEPSAEIEAGPSAELRAGKMPAPPEEKPASRPPAPYSAGGASLDWTKL